MAVAVITGPAAAVTAGQARDAQIFASSDADAFVTALLAAAQGEIDGPRGWLGRAIGVQTLEMTLDPCGRDVVLPYPEAISIVSVKDADDADLDAGAYELDRGVLRPTSTWPGGRLTIRWSAGYADADAVPPAIRHAIMLMAKTLKEVGAVTSGVRTERVDGVGEFDYSLPGNAAAAARSAGEMLLAPYRIWP